MKLRFLETPYEVLLGRWMVIIELVHYLTISILSLYIGVRYFHQLEIYFSKTHTFYPLFLLILILFIFERLVSIGTFILLTKGIYKERFHLCDDWFCIQKFMLNVTLALSLVSLAYSFSIQNNWIMVTGPLVAVLYRILSLKIILDFMKILQLKDPELVK